MRLLYRGSRDGFTAATFHSKCDGKSNTVCVIEDSDGNVFGGFADRPWHCSFKKNTRYFVRSTSSCLFSLRLASVEGRTEAARFDLLPAGSLFGLAHHYRALCIFGDKALCIYDQCNDNEESSTCLRRTYSHNGCGAHALTGGKENFRVKEVEVYEVVDPALSCTDLVAATCGGGGGGGCGGGGDAVHWREQWMHTSNKASAAAVTVSIGSADSGARIAHALSAEGPLGSWVSEGMDPSLVEGGGECVSLETALLYRGSRDGYTAAAFHAHGGQHIRRVCWCGMGIGRGSCTF